jgi:hypothetical protein
VRRLKNEILGENALICAHIKEKSASKCPLRNGLSKLLQQHAFACQKKMHPKPDAVAAAADGLTHDTAARKPMKKNRAFTQCARVHTHFLSYRRRHRHPLSPPSSAAQAIMLTGRESLVRLIGRRCHSPLPASLAVLLSPSSPAPAQVKSQTPRPETE